MKLPSLLEYRKNQIIELLEAYNNMNSDKIKQLEEYLGLSSTIALVCDKSEDEDIYYTVRFLFLNHMLSTKAYAAPTTSYNKALDYALRLKKYLNKRIDLVTLNMNDFNAAEGIYLTDTAVISELEVNDITLKDSHYQLFKEKPETRSFIQIQ